MRPVAAFALLALAPLATPALALALGPISSVAAGGAALRPPPLRVVVDTSSPMPMSQVVHGEVVDGILRDLALALARQLGASARLTPLPRKRVAVVLENGEADLSCHHLPSWLPGMLDPTVPFMPNATVLVTGVQQAPPANLDALRGVPVGTVLGFAYPEVEQALGVGFVRDDAGDAMQNLTKFAAGRIRHALTNEVFFNYQQRLHPNLLHTHRPLLITRFEAHCAVSRRGHYPVARINEAIRALQKSGQIAVIIKQK